MIQDKQKFMLFLNNILKAADGNLLLNDKWYEYYYKYKKKTKKSFPTYFLSCIEMNLLEYNTNRSGYILSVNKIIYYLKLLKNAN